MICTVCNYTENPRGWEICAMCGSAHRNPELEKISVLTWELDELNQKYSDLKSEKKKIEEKSEEKRKEIEEKLENTKNTLTETHSREISNLKQELRNRDQKYSRLESESKKHENEADTLKIKNRSLTNRIIIITPLLALLLVASLWSIYISTSEEISQKDLEIRLNDEIDSKNTEINSLKSIIKSLEKNIENTKNEVSSLNNQVSSLNNKVSSLNSDVKTSEDKFDKLVGQTESQILPGNSIVYDGKLSSLQKTNAHIFWVRQKNKYFFKLYDLSAGGHANFVITDENGTEILNTNTGGDSLSFDFDRGTYYVKVYLYGQNDVSYKLSIYRY